MPTMFAPLIVVASIFVSMVCAQNGPNVIRHQSEQITVTIDLRNAGRVSFEWPNGVTITGATAAVRIADQNELFATGFPEHHCEPAEPIITAFGRGTRISVHHRGLQGIELTQVIEFYENQPELFIRLDVTHSDGTPISTNHVTPLLLGGGESRLSLSVPIRQTLAVPFDNDGYSRFDSNLKSPTQSNEVTAIYDDTTRQGLIIGSVTHDTWKTGIEVAAPDESGVVRSLRAFGGAADERTHDREPHGAVSGRMVSSPTIFVGAFNDWRAGLQAFGKANSIIRPALKWEGGVPFGWNSWAAHKSELSVPKVQAAIGMADALRKKGFANDGVTYVNLDSFWDKLSDEQLKTLIDDAHQRGLKFGLYWTPFCFWGDEGMLSRTVDDTEGKYTFADIILRGADGGPLHRNSGAYALDPTHPGTRMRNAAFYARLVKLGIDFVKLDFVTHGALEGKHFDTNIYTGVQAYSVGLGDMIRALSPETAHRPIFVSLSIAPLFPHGYGHSRRMTCDVFASIDATKYFLNGLTYSFWTHGTLYQFNDPDHAVVYRVHDEEPVAEEIGKTRFNSSLIAGGMMLDSDDATDELARARVDRLFANPPVIALAKQAKTFLPIDGDSGWDGSSAYVLRTDDSVYIAVFNFDEKKPTKRAISLARAGLDTEERYRAVDLSDGNTIARSNGDAIAIELSSTASYVLKIEKE